MIILATFSGVPGEEMVIDSDGFFDLEVQPKKVGVIGAGYIAVELAGVFNGLGSDTSLFVRKDLALRTFDSMLSAHLDKNLKHSGIFHSAGLFVNYWFFRRHIHIRVLTLCLLLWLHLRCGRNHRVDNEKDHKRGRWYHDCSHWERKGTVTHHIPSTYNKTRSQIYDEPTISLKVSLKCNFLRIIWSHIPALIAYWEPQEDHLLWTVFSSESRLSRKRRELTTSSK